MMAPRVMKVKRGMKTMIGMLRRRTRLPIGLMARRWRSFLAAQRVVFDVSRESELTHRKKNSNNKRLLKKAPSRRRKAEAVAVLTTEGSGNNYSCTRRGTRSRG
jgi:hypothetical protein